ncbi:MAG: 4-(cytidine 5'-diphospho)-2-C-methyl-D-erythritol kinase [Candidatus Pelagibacterales bacterium]
MLETLEFKSYAKINLFLHVLNKRVDGYHNISSLISRIDLYDTITFEKNDNFEVVFKGLHSKSILNNNISKLHKYLLQHDLIKKINYKITIDKLIPVGAGLGGGSSNVATVIAVLQKLDIIKKDENINKIVRSLGSDIEFFLHDSSALVSGKGVIDKFINFKKVYKALLVKPSMNLSTADVFNANTKYTLIKDFNMPIIIRDLKGVMNNSSNDLEEAASKICPDIIEVKKELENQEGSFAHRMTGSGSTYFALFEDKIAANAAETYFKVNYPRWWSRLVSII